MKVLHTIISMNPKFGGVTEFVNKIIPPLSLNGIECEIACMDDLSDPWIKDIPLQIHALGKGKSNYSYSAEYGDWLKCNILNFDAVIINGLWQYHGWATYQACVRYKKPYFVFSHGMLDPWFKKNYPLKHIKKLIYWLAIERRVINSSRGMIFTCEEEKVLARQSFPLYHPNEYVSAFGTRRGEYTKQEATRAFLEKYPELIGKKMILFMGRIHEKKGCDLLLKAFAALPNRAKDLRLFMAGPDTDEYAVSLKKLAQALNIAKFVIWGGMVREAVKWGAYQHAQLFCLPSHQENFGIVVAEALSTGTPVLISNKVNIWREIEASQAGLVCDDNVPSLTKELTSWVLQDEKATIDQGIRAIKCFDEHFDINQAAAYLSQILQKL